MIRAIIIDDERLARNELRKLLIDFPEIEVVAEGANANEGLEKIETINPDLVFLDIQMPGKTGFDMLAELDKAPHVIFTTAYDEFIMKAFDYNSIDYLLKPVNVQEVSKAVQKYKLLQQHFNQNAQKLNNLLDYLDVPRKKRIIVKKGTEHLALKLDDVVLFYKI